MPEDREPYLTPRIQLHLRNARNAEIQGMHPRDNNKVHEAYWQKREASGNNSINVWPRSHQQHRRHLARSKRRFGRLYAFPRDSGPMHSDFVRHEIREKGVSLGSSGVTNSPNLQSNRTKKFPKVRATMRTGKAGGSVAWVADRDDLIETVHEWLRSNFPSPRPYVGIRLLDPSLSFSIIVAS